MKIELDKNGWTSIITGIDLRSASQQEMNTIAWLAAKDTVVVIRNQHLFPGDEVDICERIGVCEQLALPDAPTQGTKFVEGGCGKIVRVGGGNHHGGVAGVFEHVSDMDWHSNRTGDEARDPLIWLYGVKDSQGSRTSWINNIMSYQDLDQELKEQIKDLKLVMGFDAKVISEDTYSITARDSNAINNNWHPNLIHTNQAGVTGMFFSFLQIHQILGFDKDKSDALIQKLRLHVEQEKYTYHHDWQDGDIVLSEQWLSIHKRWRCENIQNRVVHRIALNFNHCDISRTVARTPEEFIKI
jgi:taurine dioxygenase